MPDTDTDENLKPSSLASLETDANFSEHPTVHISVTRNPSPVRPSP